MTDATVAISPLRRRMIACVTFRLPCSDRTFTRSRSSGWHCVRSPDRLGLEDVCAFQVYLVSQGISWGALDQTVFSLRFFFGVHPLSELKGIFVCNMFRFDIVCGHA